MRIDAHHHLWQPLRGDHDWMPDGDPILDRQYAPADLAPILRRHGIDRTVLVQAAATTDETEYMLGLADATEWIAGVVGWVDFEDPSQRRTLERLSRHPKFLGVRPMIQDIPDDHWMLRDDVAWGYSAVTELDLTFDALGFPRHLENFHRLLTRHPDMRVVIDHCMKPDIAGGGFETWAPGIARLARDTSACIKLSGLVTEAAEGWTLDDLRPYAAHVLDVFGPDRVMWGSDWPVCRLRAEYDAWLGAAEAITADRPEEHRAAIFGGTAARFYRIAA
ncbi:amidohydrolase family protein [Jannaschia seohaensis]|uniref:L-fuconolactonase n=1 Tax=Jannaschia seohaensis TaxID=475081 RepID=A0A2Y9A1N0_9RHOB|nr:amidohydrolase family protein [Jannaschia seohaensis]PWJ21897.1 L-fuconolactonase [Jannaschia seohaensis]SSA38175.1 L-fuconolactonase [Jannaschia seohaensis]